MKEHCLSRKQGARWLESIILIAAAFLTFGACIAQIWIAQRIPLWGDELDQMLPSFRAWRGHQSFWWQIGQFNAQVPGDNLVLRLHYKSGWLEWLRQLSPELFWRMPYITLYCSLPWLMFFKTKKWTGSPVLALAAFSFCLTSPGIFEYGSNVRFYMWLAFFSGLVSWQILEWIKRPTTFQLLAVSVSATIGVVFHVMIAPAAYFLLACSITIAAFDCIRQVRSLKTGALMLSRLFFGALPFVMYKVELKHWVFIPPPWKGIDPWAKFWEQGVQNGIVHHMAQNLAFGLGSNLIYGLWCLLCASVLLAAWRKDPKKAAQALFLGGMLLAAPIALFLSAAERNYGLMGRQFIFIAPLVPVTVVHLISTLPNRSGWLETINRSRLGQAIGLAVGIWIFIHSGAQVIEQARARSDSSPGRVTYPFIKWQQAYRNIPDQRQLVVVGTQPDRYGPFSDQEEFRAGIMKNYTAEFQPIFYSSKGTYGQNEELDRSLRLKIERLPGNYDFLLIDDSTRLQKMLPGLPWKSWACLAYKGDRPLSFCRLRGN